MAAIEDIDPVSIAEGMSEYRRGRLQLIAPPPTAIAPLEMAFSESTIAAARLCAATVSSVQSQPLPLTGGVLPVSKIEY
jgi:hypothetical protein